MTTRTSLTCAALCCVVAISLLAGAPASASPPAGPPGEVQRKAASQAAPGREAPSPAPRAKAPDAAALAERVQALEKENLVLQEDLGKARLDARTRLDEIDKREAEARARLQQKIDDLQAQLAAEREKEARRNRNLWLAVGVLALGIIAAN